MSIGLASGFSSGLIVLTAAVLVPDSLVSTRSDLMAYITRSTESPDIHIPGGEIRQCSPMIRLADMLICLVDTTALHLDKSTRVVGFPPNGHINGALGVRR